MLNLFHRRVVTKTAINVKFEVVNFRPNENMLLLKVTETVLLERMYAIYAQGPDSLLPGPTKISRNVIGLSPAIKRIPSLYVANNALFIQRRVCTMFG